MPLRSDVGRLGVLADVELAGGRGVPHPDRAPHEDDAFDVGPHLGMLGEQGRDIGQGSQRDEGQGRGGPRDRAAQELDGVEILGLPRRSRQLDPAEAVLAVDAAGVARRLGERAGHARGHRDVVPSGHAQHVERVRQDQIERHVAVDARDAEEPQRRRMRGEQERQRVVHSGVDVEDDVSRHRRTPLSALPAPLAKCRSGRRD